MRPVVGFAGQLPDGHKRTLAAFAMVGFGSNFLAITDKPLTLLSLKHLRLGAIVKASEMMDANSVFCVERQLKIDFARVYRVQACGTNF